MPGREPLRGTYSTHPRRVAFKDKAKLTDTPLVHPNKGAPTLAPHFPQTSQGLSAPHQEAVGWRPPLTQQIWQWPENTEERPGRALQAPSRVPSPTQRGCHSSRTAHLPTRLVSSPFPREQPGNTRDNRRHEVASIARGSAARGRLSGVWHLCQPGDSAFPAPLAQGFADSTSPEQTPSYPPYGAHTPSQALLPGQFFRPPHLHLKGALVTCVPFRLSGVCLYEASGPHSYPTLPRPTLEGCSGTVVEGPLVSSTGEACPSPSASSSRARHSPKASLSASQAALHPQR